MNLPTQKKRLTATGTLAEPLVQLYTVCTYLVLTLIELISTFAWINRYRTGALVPIYCLGNGEKNSAVIIEQSPKTPRS